MDDGLTEVWRDQHGFHHAVSYVVSYENPLIWSGSPVLRRKTRTGYDHRTLLSIAHHIQFPDAPVMLPTAFQELPDRLPDRARLERLLGRICPGLKFSDL